MPDIKVGDLVRVRQDLDSRYHYHHPLKGELDVPKPTETNIDEHTRFEDLPDVMFLTEVAAFLRCSVRSVRYYIERRRLDGYKVGQHLRVTRVALGEFLGVPTETSEPRGTAQKIRSIRDMPGFHRASR